MIISTCSLILNRGSKRENELLIVEFASEVGIFFAVIAKKLCRFEDFSRVEFLHRSYQKRRRGYINYIEKPTKTMANADSIISACQRRIAAYDSAFER